MSKVSATRVKPATGPSAFGTAALAVLLAAHASGARSADWALEPRVGIAAEADDNHRLTDIPGQEIKVSGAAVNAQVGIRSETPTTSFILTPRVRSTFYPGDKQEETDDWYLRMALRHKSERIETSLVADYSSRITFGEYFPAATVSKDDQLGNPDRGVNVGNTAGRNREDRLAVTPWLTFQLAPRHALEFGAEYIDLAYDVQVPDGNEDYASLTGTAGYRFSLSETSRINIRATAGRFDPSDGLSTDGYGLRAGWTNRVSDTSEVYVNAGATRTQIASKDVDGKLGWENGFTGGAGVRWEFQVTQVFVDLNRYVEPTSTGRLATRDQLRIGLTRRLGEKTTAYVGARAIKDSGSGVAGGGSFRGTKYAAANLGFEWRFSRQFSLVGGYDYTWREYEDAATDAQANAVRLGVVYEPKRL